MFHHAGSWGGGWIAWSRWGSLGGGGRVVAAGASLSHLALRLPGRAQQLGFVPLPLSAGTETLQEKIHSVLSGPPSLVSLVILQPDDHGPVDRLDGNFSLWQGVLEPVPIVVLQGRYNNLINANQLLFDLCFKCV